MQTATSNVSLPDTVPVDDLGSPVLAAAPHRIGGVTIAVHDLPRVSAFYQEVVGLTLRDESANTVVLGSPSAGLLRLQGEPAARAHDRRDAGLFHTAFLLPSRGHLGAWLSHAAARRFPLLGASDHSVSEAVYLSDPEGNGVEIYADRPRSTWKVTDGAIEMTTGPLDFADLMEAGQEVDWSGWPAGAIVGHMHLQTGNLPSAEAFYSGLLGFDVTCRYPGAVFYGSGGYHHQIATNIWNSRAAAPLDGTSTGLRSYELIARDAETIEVARDRLSASAVPFSEVGNGISLRDPAGIGIVLKTG
ncbi:catechol 2,3-dioxygenase [Faunimonas pinastri]|uniref:Catechol 2,3-dioxygenase n=1 Tax=Faunimonas pinastri TaxID=1855383 RepID=A0A1H9C203_9HYPH|nr:VOC family protein [Faunimonas pinastri]SEP95305.1 catechol 2,3-dioxygenase [Faunimonas pinastri]